MLIVMPPLSNVFLISFRVCYVFEHKEVRYGEEMECEGALVFSLQQHVNQVSQPHCHCSTTTVVRGFREHWSLLGN